MNILVDVNVFEDVFRQRIGWEASLAVIGSVANTQVTGYVSALTPPIRQKEITVLNPEELVKRLVTV